AATVLLERRDHAGLWALCAALRDRGVWGAHLPSAMASAATTVRQVTDISRLIDPARWLSVGPLGISERVNARLLTTLRSHKSRTPLPSTKATVGRGERIDSLDTDADPDMHAL